MAPFFFFWKLRLLTTIAKTNNIFSLEICFKCLDWSLIPLVNLVILVLMITLMEFSSFNWAPKQFKSKGIIENYSSLSKEKWVHLAQWMCSTRCAIPSGTRRKCKGVLQYLMENARQDYYKRVYSYFQGFWYQRVISLEFKVDSTVA